MNKQGVRSSDGFEFQFTGRSAAEYREGRRRMDLEVSEGASAIDINNGGPLHWTHSSNLSAEETARVLNNIRAALEFMGMRLWERERRR